jgi:NAD(P)-dependent dehydrogenase (short-subunit alcohol dehydrogenase family)
MAAAPTSTVGAMSREPRLAGKVAVISGASRGFGQAIAVRFVEEGAKVVMLSRSGCDETLGMIRSIGGFTGDVDAVWLTSS